MVWFLGTLQPRAGSGQEGRGSVSLEENKALVRRFLEEQARGNLGVIDELLSPDFVDRGLLPGQGRRRTSKASTSTASLTARSPRSGARRTRCTRRWSASNKRCATGSVSNTSSGWRSASSTPCSRGTYRSSRVGRYPTTTGQHGRSGATSITS